MPAYETFGTFVRFDPNGIQLGVNGLWPETLLQDTPGLSHPRELFGAALFDPGFVPIRTHRVHKEFLYRDPRIRSA